MWKFPLFSLFAGSSLIPSFRSGHCLRCQLLGAGTGALQPLRSSSLRRYAGYSGRRPASNSAQGQKGGTPPPAESAPNDNDEFAPRTLDRPIGLLYPPQEGQNTGVDMRTLRERRDDFVDYEKHLKRRQELYDTID
jgi:mitochondrial ATPase complex subunit ATP10